MQMFLLIMKTWRECMFFGRFRWTFLIQTCEGYRWGKKISWVCWQTVLNCKKRRLSRKLNWGNFFSSVHLRIHHSDELGWCYIIFSNHHSPPAYLSLEFDGSCHLYTVPILSCSLFVYFVFFSLHHLHEYSLFFRSLCGFLSRTQLCLFCVHLLKPVLMGDTNMMSHCGWVLHRHLVRKTTTWDWLLHISICFPLTDPLQWLSNNQLHQRPFEEQHPPDVLLY